ncbi:hypothetical protein [Streptomyces sp. V3I7]|uniref:hypothetical protein n=1 Tax=Streptomyces sp. V3I7 TaxID=3042278 RepID=UPI0027D7EE89|nr:hypothetical protein [Streptomyces sp. V3I7]
MTLEGRAWSGQAPVTAVEVSTDDGATWRPAELDPVDGHRWAWRRWHLTWDAGPGSHVLAVRATDADGHTQPAIPHWNRGGFANNAIHTVPVLCQG